MVFPTTDKHAVTEFQTQAFVCIENSPSPMVIQR